MMSVNVDLASERSRCSFDPSELTYFLEDGKANTLKRREIEDKIYAGFGYKIPFGYLSHKELYEEEVRRFTEIFMMSDDYVDVFENTSTAESSTLGTFLKHVSPMAVHYIGFIPSLKNHGTPEQQARWLRKAENCNILGTYAQTELGHGTFLRGLETIAEYDEKTQEFILNSPTLTSYKWWPGGLGHTANHAIVVAQLYTKGQHCGIQLFLVQIRDLETHMPLPGITVGEIGSKMGINGANNGFLGFKNVRIPRENMLMKNAQVNEDGTFTTSSNSKLAYGTMVFIRVIMISDMGYKLMNATTIATRYSAVRRQCTLDPAKPESQILDYVTQQYKLFPNIATAIVFANIGDWLWKFYKSVLKEMESDNFDNLQELHAVTCCLKAISTTDASLGVETCRLSCGGHGYMNSSNLPHLYTTATAGRTYEGENTVLLLQTARYLMKCWNGKSNGGKLPSTLDYLSTITVKSQAWKSSFEGILLGSQQIVVGKVSSCAETIARYMKSGTKFEDAWNKSSIQLVEAAEAYCRCVIVDKFNQILRSKLDRVSLNLKKVLLLLHELYVVYWVLNRSGDFLRYTNITGKDLEGLQERLEGLLLELRPQAVGIVDGFDIRDEVLNSTLGAYDGRVYERLLEDALKSPLNAEPVNRVFYEYLKPMMRAKL